jgi:hypothetical protein
MRMWTGLKWVKIESSRLSDKREISGSRGGEYEVSLKLNDVSEALMMEAVRISVTSVFYETPWRHISDACVIFVSILFLNIKLMD